MHRLLKRQIRKYLSEEDQIKYKDFLQTIDLAYCDFDDDHKQLELILEKSSQELFKLNNELKNTLAKRTLEVKNASERLETVVSNITEVIFQSDLNGKWLYLNSSWERITGFTVEETMQCSIPDFLHEEDVSCFSSKLKELVEGINLECSSEVRIAHIDGYYKWCEVKARLFYDEEGTIAGLAGSMKDVSKRKDIEKEKNLSEQKFKILFEQSSVAYLISKEDKFIECNQACLDLFGFENKEDFIDNYVSNFSPQYQPNGKLSAELSKEKILVAHQKGKNKFDWIHVKADGTEFPVEVFLNSISLIDENVIFVVLTDLSKRKRFEQELIVAKEKAEQASRAKAQFLSTMSHEIRTPMNAVIGVTHLLSQDNPREDQISNLNILKLSADNLMALINDILDFSKIEAGKAELEKIDFNFRNLIKNIAASFKLKSKEKGLDFTIEIDPRFPKYMLGDPTRISQIISNLADNAIKFTDRGYIKIRANYLYSKGENIRLQFEIIDTGIGIPKDKVHQIFDSFSQADSNTTRLYGGTGLGLSITCKLAEMMNGKVTVESEMNSGTTFFVEIDLAVSTKANTKVNFTSDYHTEDSSIKGLHVLIAEDNPVNEMIIKQFLTKWNVTYEVAKNGSIALEKVKGAKFDMILMDLQMPEMDGYHAAKNIRELGAEHFHNIPIIAITASAFNEIRTKVMEAGMNDFVTKPINPEELYVKLKKYVP
jgi:PAS domain S-box-containing protein